MPQRAGPVCVIVYLLLGLLLVDLVVAAHRPLWATYDPHEYASRLETCRSSTHDLVVAGGSVVAEGIDTRLLDDAFNLGLSGGTATDVLHGVEHGLTSPPRRLVYGITASDLNDSRDEPAGVQALMDAGDLIACCRQRPSRSEWFARHWLGEHLGRAWQLWRYRNAIRLWAADHFESLFPEAAEEARRGRERSALLKQPHGFAPYGDTHSQDLSLMKPKARARMPFAFLDNYKLGGHLASLYRLLDWGKSQGVETLLMDMPVSADLERRFPNEFAVYRETLRSVAREHGFRLLDAHRDHVGLTDADFGDLIHLNARGAEKLTLWLRERIEAVP